MNKKNNSDWTHMHTHSHTRYIYLYQTGLQTDHMKAEQATLSRDITNQAGEA